MGENLKGFPQKSRGTTDATFKASRDSQCSCKTMADGALFACSVHFVLCIQEDFQECANNVEAEMPKHQLRDAFNALK